MSLRISRFALVLSLLGSTVLQAENAPAAIVPYELKNKSLFAPTSPEKRAPFWPIGWSKRKAAQFTGAPRLVVVPKITLDPKNFRVTSILLGQPSLAIINGRTYSEGEFLRQPRAQGGGATVATSPVPPGARIRIFRINDGSVVLDHQEQQITIPLQRPELGERKSEQELLFDER